MKKKKVVDTREVQKAHMALFWNDLVISGECRFTAKKYPDGLVIFEITYTQQLDAKQK